MAKRVQAMGARGTEATAKLDAWLAKHNAHCLWQKKLDSGDFVEAWVTQSGRVCLVVRFRKNMGWNIFTGIDDIDIEATLADAEKRLGIKGT